MEAPAFPSLSNSPINPTLFQHLQTPKGQNLEVGPRSSSSDSDESELGDSGGGSSIEDEDVNDGTRVKDLPPPRSSSVLEQTLLLERSKNGEVIGTDPRRPSSVDISQLPAWRKPPSILWEQGRVGEGIMIIGRLLEKARARLTQMKKAKDGSGGLEEVHLHFEPDSAFQ
jgi:hypothetical protein